MAVARANDVSYLIASNSKASHDIAMQQMRGGFADELQGLREQLIHFAIGEIGNRFPCQQSGPEPMRVRHPSLTSILA